MRLNSKIFINLTAYVLLTLLVLASFSILKNYLNKELALNNVHYFTNIILAIIPLIGAVSGFYRFKEWGGFHSKIAISILLLSSGLLVFFGGTVIWLYYNNFLNTPVPYPSIADLIYIFFQPLAGIGTVLFAYLSAVKTNPNDAKSKLYFFFIPAMLAIVTYYFVFLDAHNGTLDFSQNNLLKLLVDFAYPMGDVTILTLVVLVSGTNFNYLGKRLATPFTLIMLGQLFNYIADFTFSYSTTVGTYVNGNYTDLLYITAMFFIALGVNAMRPKLLIDEDVKL